MDHLGRSSRRILLGACLLLVSTAGRAPGQPITLVKDLRTAPEALWVQPSAMVAIGSTVFFVASGEATGSELWWSDGTPAGTRLVKDIRPGKEGSNVQQLTNANGTLFFQADDGTNGAELWRSDGTEAGTAMVKDVYSGPGGSGPWSLAAVGGVVYFSARDDTTGLELWRSDGTPTGTWRVKDINPGNGSSNPSNLVAMSGTLYFGASDATSGQELWKSDGTESGTVLVKDICAGSCGSSPASFVGIGSVAYFSANDGTNGQELWRTDGTPTGTALVKDVRTGSSSSSPQLLTNVAGVLFFGADDGVHARELWKSDGTGAGTVLVKDVCAGSCPSNLNSFVAFGGLLYFSASDGVNGRELWKSNGTEGGTALVKDLCSGVTDSVVTNLTVLSGSLYFQANDCVSGVELWASDGTADGTTLVKDVCPGSCSSTPSPMVATSSALYFGANDGTHGPQLWKSDGTGGGTVILTDATVLSSFAGALTDLSGTLIFAAYDPVDEMRTLWKSDGSTAGTTQLALGRLTSPTSLVAWGGKVFLSGDTGGGNYELWSTNGTEAGTIVVKEICPGGCSSSPSLLTPTGGPLFFVANDGTSGFELWASDGTEGGTVLAKDIRPGSGNSSIQYVTRVGSRVFFAANDGTNGRELWVSDGTGPGTTMVKDIWPGGSSSDPRYLTDVNGTLFFTANDGTREYLFKSDGTTAGTTTLGNVYANESVNLNGVLVFHGNWGQSELWRSDGTAGGTVLVRDINPNGSSTPTYLTVAGPYVYFRAADGTSGVELWRSDGTTAGTVRVRDINPGSGSSLPRNLTPVGNGLTFVANDGVHGEELWKTDGTEAGTFMVQDLNPGAAHSNIGQLLLTAARLYLTADDGVVGQELWKLGGIDLAVSKAASSSSPAQGSTLRWTITVSNAGPSAATGVTLLDTLPAGVAFVSSSPGSPACTLASGTLTCALGTIAAAANAVVTIDVTVNAGFSGPLTNTVRAVALEPDSVSTNDSAFVTVTVPGPQPATNLQARAVSTSSITLDWTDSPSSQTGVRIERSGDGVTWATAGSVGAHVTTFTNTSLSAGTLYSYRVVVLQSGVGESAPSNVAVARTFPASAAKVCTTRLGPHHTWSRYPAVAWNGVKWGAVWQARTPSRELDEVFFQFLDAPSGLPTGLPANVSDDDVNSSYPTVRWNGSRFAVVWYPGVRGAAGQFAGQPRLALLDGDGNKVRGNVSLGLSESDGPNVYINDNAETAMAWTGSEWGFVLPAATGTEPQIDLFFVRVSAEGDRIGAPVRLTNTPENKYDISLAWNGTEYGVSWVWFGGPPSVYFQRMQADGTLIGTPTLVMANPNGVSVTSAVWNGTGWAVAFTEVGGGPDYPTWTNLARLDANGTLNGSPVRVSPDYDPGFPPEDQKAIYDEVPSLFSKPGGGYVIFGSSQANVVDASMPTSYEISRYETDATGARIGTRTILSTDDLRHSVYGRAAFDGSRYLVVYNDASPGTQEIARVLAGTSGPALAGPSLLSSGGSPRNTWNIATSSQPLSLTVGNGFAVIWGESAADSTYQLGTKVFDGAGDVVASLWPISTRTFRSRPGGVGVGDTFALAWKDNPNNVVFDRYDATGASLLGEVVVATGQSGRPGVAIAFSGESYGLAWIQGTNLAFQLIAGNGALIGARTIVALGATPANVQPQIAWTGSGWAVVYVLGTDLQYLLFAPSGAVSVSPVALTATTTTKSAFSIAWNGTRLGLAWADNPNVAPWADILFTSVGPNGVKDFAPVNVASSEWNEGNPSLYWDTDRFRLVHTFSQAGFLREIGIYPNGTLAPGAKLLSNRGGANSVAFNGATAGIAWQQMNDDYFETTACTADTTPPPCPSASASVSGRTATIGWTPVADFESGLYRYYVYRNGLTLAEVFPSTTTVFDGDFPPGVTHSYEVRAYNGAWLESTGCAAFSPSTDLSVAKTDGATTEVPGTPVTYTITVTNGGPSTVTSVTLTDPVPASLTSAVFTPAAGSWNSGTGLWSGLNLGIGQSVSITLAATIDPAARGSLSNTATVGPTAGVVDPNGSNDTAADVDALVPSANLAVSITDAPDPVLQGATFVYSLGTSNAGPSTATAVVLAVTLPPGTTFLSSTPGSPTCIHASGTVTCNLGGLTVGASTLASIQVKPNAGTVGTITATATVTAVESDPDTLNNTASSQTTVPGPVPARDLRVTSRTTTTVSLKWTDPEGPETGFRIERSTDGVTWTGITIVDRNATTHTDTGRSPATLYFYRVVAIQSGVGESAPSNAASATTLATVAAGVCAAQMGPSPGGASGPTVAWSGTSWAAAWTDRRDGLLEEVYFQRLDPVTGSPLGSQLRVTSTGASSSARALRWNGSRYGLLWTEQMKAPDGSLAFDFRFTSFNGAGSRLQGDVSAFRLDNELFWGSQETPLVWNGGGWGVFLARASTPPSDVRYYRLDETGRPLGAPVAVTATPEWEMSVSAAWSGSAYGVSWVKSGTTGGPYQVLFQRIALDGTLLGSPVLVWQNTTASSESFLIGSTSILWDGSSWVVAFTDVGPDPDKAEAVYLRRVSAAGVPSGAAVRLSPSYDPDFPPEELVPVYDMFPVLFTKPGGDYVVFTSSWLKTTGLQEACRYEAGASFARFGTRTQISTGDSRASTQARAATDGSRCLVSWNENRSGSPEIAAALVDSSGAIQAGPTELTSGHPSGGSSNPIALALGSGFGALYTASASSAVQPTIAGQFWDGSGALVAARSPLSTRSVRGMPGAVAVGSTFALAWKDATNTLAFARYDATGAPLVSEATVATGVGGRPNVGLAFGGDVYGLAFFAGNDLSFQRVAPDGSLVGSRTTVTTTSLHGPPGPQIQWVGTGWAIVWLQAGNLFYARLDPSGTVAVPPIQVTFTTQTEAGYQLLWTGTHLGLAWYEYMLPDPPGGEVFFTVLSLDGVKAFEPVPLGSSSLDDYNPSPYWDVDRFRVVMVPGMPNVLREVSVLPDGTVLPEGKTYFNRGGLNGVAWNGATLGIAWRQLGFTYFETTTCLADATPPPCPPADAVFDGSKTTVSWTQVTDSESGIWSFGVYRDGLMVAEEAATTTSWADTGPMPGVNHSYQVRAVNRALKESIGCAGVVPSADVGVSMTDAPDPVQPSGTLTYSLTIQNGGPSSASGITLTDTLPAGVSFVSVTPPSPSCLFAAGTVTCALGTLSSGQSTNVAIVVTMSSSTPVTNTASMTAQQPDPTSTNNSASATTTVCPAAPVATSNTPVCEGGSLQLSASTVAGGTYSWTGPNGFLSTAQNPTIAAVTTAASGTYSVTVTVGGGTSVPGTTNVVVNPRPLTPVITAPANVFPGHSFTASVPDVAGVSYAWTVTNGTVTAGSGTRQITVTAGEAGPVLISVTETNPATTCASTAASVSVPVGPPPTRFHTVPPCRLFDTRLSEGPAAGAPMLAPGETRTLSVGTRCGVSSSTVRSLSVNQTVTLAAADGELVLFRGDLASVPISSSITYRAGGTRANNGILELSRAGDGTFQVHNRSTGSVHFILDVSGAFQ